MVFQEEELRIRLVEELLFFVRVREEEGVREELFLQAFLFQEEIARERIFEEMDREQERLEDRMGMGNS